MNSKNSFTKTIAILLSAATILTVASPCTFAQNNLKEEPKITLRMAANAVIDGAMLVGGIFIIRHALRQIKNSPIHVEDLKGTPQYDNYMFLKNTIENCPPNVKREDMKKLFIFTENISFRYKGFDINARFDKGETLLHIATMKNSTSICRFLIEKGADINAENNHGHTPLHFAAMDGNYNVCKLLLDKGANINIPNIAGCTPLFFAAMNGHYDICKLLLDKGADVNAKGMGTMTPLLISTVNNHKNICELLIAYGADTTAKDKFDNMPLD